MKILCWNVAGIRARINNNHLEFLLTSDFDIVCFQETKAKAEQVTIPDKINKLYPYKFWQSNTGITQRVGFSGTAIWSKIKPIQEVYPEPFDTEGRITTIEFKEYYLVCVYTPNSQDIASDRCTYRNEIWDPAFREYITKLSKKKNIIICGDFNVAFEDKDIYDPQKHRNRSAGFLNCERYEFQKHLDNGFVDVLRHFNKEKDLYTYWNQRAPQMRINNKGWRIDYFLTNKDMIKNIKSCHIHKDILGSDHCPISVEIHQTQL